MLHDQQELQYGVNSFYFTKTIFMLHDQQELQYGVNSCYFTKKSLKIPRGNQNSYIEEEQKDKQRSTKHTHKTKDSVTRNLLNTGVNSGAPGGYAVPAPPGNKS